MRTSRRRATATFLVAVLIAVPLAGCSGNDPLTADNIRQRVADAMREAKTFHFTWTSRNSSDEPITYQGQIEYRDNGKVLALEVTSKQQGTYRLVDGTMYHRPPGDGMFEKLAKDEKTQVVKVWDYAKAIESWPDPTKVRKKGEEDVGDEPTIRYELTMKRGEEKWTVTWWIAEDDRLVRSKSTAQHTMGRITDYGEPIDIPPMAK